jgi:hypothetical protein
MTKEEAEMYFHHAIKNGYMSPEELEGLSDFALCELADRMAARGDAMVDNMIENEIDDMRMANSSSGDEFDPRLNEEEFNSLQ